MHLEAIRPGPLTNAFEILFGIVVTSAEIRGVFQTDETGVGEVLVVGPDFSFELGKIEETVLSFDQSASDTAECGGRTGFEIGDVAPRFDEEFVAGIAVYTDAHLIGLGSRAGVDGGFLPKEFAAEAFEFIDRWVFGDHVVTDLGGCDGSTHAWGWTGDCVAAHVDGGIEHGDFRVSEGGVWGWLRFRGVPVTVH